MARLSNYRQALVEFGLPPEYDLRSVENFDRAMAVWKELTVTARRNGNDERAATLSLCKTLVQKKHQTHRQKICPRCGNFKGRNSLHCGMCNRIVTHYSDKLEVPEPMFHKVEATPIAIPPIAHDRSELALAMSQLSTGHIGDSFLTNKSASTCILMAKIMGGVVTCRTANPQEKDHKKRQYRVWRTDNYSMEEANEIIKKRVAGEKIEKPAAWIPMSPEEAQKYKNKKKKTTSP